MARSLLGLGFSLSAFVCQLWECINRESILLYLDYNPSIKLHHAVFSPLFVSRSLPPRSFIFLFCLGTASDHQRAHTPTTTPFQYPYEYVQ